MQDLNPSPFDPIENELNTTILCQHCLDEKMDGSGEEEFIRPATKYIASKTIKIRQPICDMCLDEMYSVYTEDAHDLIVTQIEGV